MFGEKKKEGKFPKVRPGDGHMLKHQSVGRRRQDGREAALLFPESLWHLRCGLSPVSFHDNPEYKTPS